MKEYEYMQGPPGGEFRVWAPTVAEARHKVCVSGLRATHLRPTGRSREVQVRPQDQWGDGWGQDGKRQPPARPHQLWTVRLPSGAVDDVVYRSEGEAHIALAAMPPGCSLVHLHEVVEPLREFWTIRYPDGSTRASHGDYRGWADYAIEQDAQYRTGHIPVSTRVRMLVVPEEPEQ